MLSLARPALVDGLFEIGEGLPLLLFVALGLPGLEELIAAALSRPAGAGDRLFRPAGPPTAIAGLGSDPLGLDLSGGVGPLRVASGVRRGWSR